MSDTELKFAQVDGHSIAYREGGQGPALVLLHGFLCDSRCWRRQVTALSDRFRVVAWDAPGAGSSSDPTEPFTTADYARCLGRSLTNSVSCVPTSSVYRGVESWPRSSTACIPNVCAVWFWPTRMPAGRDHFLSRCAGNGWRVASVMRWPHPAPLSRRCCPASSAMALLKTFRTSRRPSCLSSTRLASAYVDLIRRDGHPRSPPEDSGAHAVAVGRHGSSQSGARRRATARRHSRRRACDHPGGWTPQ